MTSNTRLSILKPGRPREPLQDLSQLLPTNDDEETTTTDNHKRRVSFACVNKVKEFETEAECTTLRQTPAYDERFSMSSDSCQSSLLSEVSHNKSTFLSYADASKISNRSEAYGENIDVVELGLHSVSRGARSPGKIGGGDSSMNITSVIVRNEHEHTDYDCSSESYYPLNLTKSASSRQSIARVDAADDKDVLETSSMETTEALPCLMTETIITDFESFSQTMDISVEEVAAEEEKTSRSSMNLTMGPEKVFHFRESTTLLSEKDVQKALQSEIPCWTVISMTDSEWRFGALWNRLHLVITLPENENQCVSKLRFMKKHSENGDVGDEILKVAIAPIIRKYRKKMDELCSKVEDVIIFMKMTLPSINFAENFAENFSEIIEFEDVSSNNGFASFLVANYGAHLLAKIQVDMRNIDDFSNSSIEVKQHIGRIDEVKVRKIFFEARGDFDFFSKFVKNLNCMLTVT